MNLKNIFVFIVLMLICGITFASAELIDYDTFTRSVIGTSEGQGNNYTSTDGDAPRIENGVFTMDTYGEATLTFTDNQINEFTVYAKLKSSATTLYSEFTLQNYDLSEAIAIVVVDTNVDSDYYLLPNIGFTPTPSDIKFDEWVDVYFYINYDLNITNVTISNGSDSFSVSYNLIENNLTKLYFYTEDSDSLLAIDEWAMCSGFDMECKPLKQIANCQEINESGDYYLSGDIDATSWESNFGKCIDINVDNVNIDCMGNTIEGNPTYASYKSFYLQGVQDITIQNCEIVGGVSGIFIDTSDNVHIENNTFREILLVGADNNGYALEVTGDITEPVLFYNNTITDSNSGILLNHALTDNSDLDVYHNNFLELTGFPVSIYLYDGAKGRLTIRNNAYNLEEACIDFANDGICDTSYGTEFFIDTLPIKCIDGWRGGTTGCSYSKFAYSSNDLSASVIDILVKGSLVISSLIVIVLLVVSLSYGMKKIKE